MEDKLPEQEPTDSVTEDADLEEEEETETEPRPAFVINFYSWATPIVGLLMLLVGLAGGYFGRPLLLGKFSPTPTVAPTAAASQEQQANAAVLMAQVVAATHHFKGSATAPVTIVEFSDYQ